MKKSIDSIGKAMDKANSVVEVFTGYMIFAFMALLFLQVLMRFIFKHPIYGIDECVTALMIWSMCLGWCTVYWDNGHAVLEFIMNRMPKAFRRGMFTFTNFLIVVMQKEKKQKYQEMISIEEYLMKRRKQKEIEDRQFRQEESPAFFAAELYV